MAINLLPDPGTGSRPVEPAAPRPQKQVGPLPRPAPPPPQQPQGHVRQVETAAGAGHLQRAAVGPPGMGTRNRAPEPTIGTAHPQREAVGPPGYGDPAQAPAPARNTVPPGSTWQVQAGDNFYTMARQTLATQWGRQPTEAEVHQYVLQMADYNGIPRSRLTGDLAANPLIHPGDRFPMPPMKGGWSQEPGAPPGSGRGEPATAGARPAFGHHAASQVPASTGGSPATASAPYGGVGTTGQPASGPPPIDPTAIYQTPQALRARYGLPETIQGRQLVDLYGAMRSDGGSVLSGEFRSGASGDLYAPAGGSPSPAQAGGYGGPAGTPDRGLFQNLAGELRAQMPAAPGPGALPTRNAAPMTRPYGDSAAGNPDGRAAGRQMPAPAGRQAAAGAAPSHGPASADAGSGRFRSAALPASLTHGPGRGEPSGPAIGSVAPGSSSRAGAAAPDAQSMATTSPATASTGSTGLAGGPSGAAPPAPGATGTLAAQLALSPAGLAASRPVHARQAAQGREHDGERTPHRLVEAFASWVGNELGVMLSTGQARYILLQLPVDVREMFQADPSTALAESPNLLVVLLDLVGKGHPAEDGADSLLRLFDYFVARKPPAERVYQFFKSLTVDQVQHLVIHRLEVLIHLPGVPGWAFRSYREIAEALSPGSQG